jgi:hypothetical protein
MTTQSSALSLPQHYPLLLLTSAHFFTLEQHHHHHRHHHRRHLQLHHLHQPRFLCMHRISIDRLRLPPPPTIASLGQRMSMVAVMLSAAAAERMCLTEAPFLPQSHYSFHCKRLPMPMRCSQPHLTCCHLRCHRHHCNHHDHHHRTAASRRSHPLLLHTSRHHRHRQQHCPRHHVTANRTFSPAPSPSCTISQTHIPKLCLSFLNSPQFFAPSPLCLTSNNLIFSHAILSSQLSRR